MHKTRWKDSNKSEVTDVFKKYMELQDKIETWYIGDVAQGLQSV